MKETLYRVRGIEGQYDIPVDHPLPLTIGQLKKLLVQVSKVAPSTLNLVLSHDQVVYQDQDIARPEFIFNLSIVPIRCMTHEQVLLCHCINKSRI
jgi:hypothetical protein